jgi:opacity protein-like surface antigen
MMRRPNVIRCASVAAILLLALSAGATNADAQIRRVEPTQSIGFNLGYFAVRAEDAREGGDVLLANLFDFEPLAFDVRDFNWATVGGEWLFGFGEYLEGGVGLGFYRRTVPSVYANVVHETGREIEQDLRLRVVPASFTVRFLPVGRGGIEPYVGAGLGLFNWRYSEVGEFVDTRDFSVFRDRFVANGTSTGALVLGGIRFPVGGLWLVGGELRYQRAQGSIDMVETDLLGDRIDLGGWATNFTVHMRF